MKNPLFKALIIGIVAVGASAPVFAQTTNPWLAQWYRAKFGRPLPAEAAQQNSMQRAHPVASVASASAMDLANCMRTTKQVQLIIDQMTRVGTPLSRGRVNYSSRDLVVLSERELELYAALNTLTTVHEELRNSLGEAHDLAIAKRLNKLDRLEAKLRSGSAQIGHDLASVRPGPWSHEVSWDVDAVRNTANKWQAVHEQLAKELDLAM